MLWYVRSRNNGFLSLIDRGRSWGKWYFFLQCPCYLLTSLLHDLWSGLLYRLPWNVWWRVLFFGNGSSVFCYRGQLSQVDIDKVLAEVLAVERGWLHDHPRWWFSSLPWYLLLLLEGGCLLKFHWSVPLRYKLSDHSYTFGRVLFAQVMHLICRIITWPLYFKSIRSGLRSIPCFFFEQCLKQKKREMNYLRWRELTVFYVVNLKNLAGCYF